MLTRRRVDKFKAWAAEHAIHFEPLDGVTADIEKLTVLDEALKGKRIVYLGESDHYIHELYEFRLLLTRYLFSRGWRWIGEELGVCDGARIDQYYATGDEAHLHRIPSFGYRGASRTDRTEWEALNPAMAVREEGMFRRLSHALSRLGPTEKVILQSHAGHLSKDWPAARTPGGKPPPASVGTRIHQAFPGDVFAIWMVNGYGRDAQPYPSLSSDLRLRPGTLNVILAEVGSCFLLPTRDADSRADLLSRKMGMSWIYTTSSAPPWPGRRTRSSLCGK